MGFGDREVEISERYKAEQNMNISRTTQHLDKANGEAAARLREMLNADKQQETDQD